jgi:hypothetical protein
LRDLFKRYEAAWQQPRRPALQALGQVASQGQWTRSSSYFESVKDLDVEVRHPLDHHVRRRGRASASFGAIDSATRAVPG